MTLMRDGAGGRGRDLPGMPRPHWHPEGTRIAGLPQGTGGTPSPADTFRRYPSGMLTTTSFRSLMLLTAKRGPSRVLPLSLTPP
jgi:hypothetical protein